MIGEPHQMRLADFLKTSAGKGADGATLEAFRGVHRTAVENAVKAGKSVDPVVLADHSDLAQQLEREKEKKPHEYSRAEYLSGYDPAVHPRGQQFSAEHRAAVEAAVRAGEPVSPEVLKDYPDLDPAAHLDKLKAGLKPGEWVDRDAAAQMLDSDTDPKTGNVANLVKLSRLADAGHVEIEGGKVRLKESDPKAAAGDEPDRPTAAGVAVSDELHAAYKSLRLGDYRPRVRSGEVSHDRHIGMSVLAGSTTDHGDVDAIPGLGWVRRRPSRMGYDPDPEQHVSLNVAADSGLVYKLDEFAAKHGIPYKVPSSADEWLNRHDPVTLYPPDELTADQRAELVKIAEPYARGDEGLIGEKIGKGVAVLKEPKPADAAAVVEKARTVSPELAEGVAGYLGRQPSAGQMHVARQMVEARAPKAEEPKPDNVQRDLLGRAVPRKFGKSSAVQPTIEDAIRESWTQRAKEHAAEAGKLITEYSASGRFKMGGEWYEVGKAEDGHPITKVEPDKPAAAPQQAYQLDNHATAPASAAHVEEVHKSLRAVPDHVHASARRFGVKAGTARRVTDFLPELAGQAPRGWPVGRTWDHADGLYHPSSKTAVLTEEYLIGDTPVKTSRAGGVALHEYGHGVDRAIGAELAGLDLYSKSGRFQNAYHKDVSGIPDTARKKLGYYLQSGHAGPEEVFAEAFAQIHHPEGKGAAAKAGEVLKHFPNCAAVIKAALEAVKE